MLTTAKRAGKGRSLRTTRESISNENSTTRHTRLPPLKMGSGFGRVTKAKGSHKRGRRKRFLAKAVDQVHEDLADPMRAEALRSDQPIDFDLPGMGQYYCVECARYFIAADALNQHTRTKKHKIRLKELKEKPYSQAEAESAVGMAPPDNGLAVAAPM